MYQIDFKKLNKLSDLMGNIYSGVGIDSFKCVDDAITNLLFCPPETKKEELLSLGNRKHT